MEETPDYQDIVHVQLVLTIGTNDLETDDPTLSVTGCAGYLYRNARVRQFMHDACAKHSALGVSIYKFEADRTFPDRFN